MASTALPAHAQNCTAHFPFDGNLADATGSGLDGVMLTADGQPGTATFVEGRNGQALELDGHNVMRAFVDLQSDKCPQVTISAWVRVDPSVSPTRFVVSTGLPDTPGFRLSGGGLTLNGPGNGLYERDVFRPQGGWTFIAGVYDYAEDYYRLHWRTRGSEPLQLGDNLRNPAEALWVGAMDDLLAHASAGVAIDDLRIIGRALDAEQLAALQRGGSDPAEATAFSGDWQGSPCDNHEACGTGSYCGFDNRCHPDRHAPKRDLELELADAPLQTGQVLSTEAGTGDSSTLDDTLADMRDGTRLSPEAEEALTERVMESRPPELPPPSNDEPLVTGLPQPDYAIAQVNSRITESNFMYGMDLPLAVRVQVSGVSDQAEVVFYPAIGEPGSNEAVVLGDRYQGTGSGAHVVSLTVPLESPLVVGDQFKADLFLIGEKEMPGLPGQTVTIKTPIEDTNPDNNRESLVYDVHRPKGYVLTHEHPTYGMAFGGNYAFAGAPGNYRHGIMDKGYTAECSGCKLLGKCDHGEVKGSFVGWSGSLGRDMGDHFPQMGPFFDSNSHLRYSTEWIEEAFSPSEPAYEDARMRIMVAFAVENEAMCEQLYYVNKGNGGPGGDGYPCSHGDSFDSLKRQLDNLKAWAAEHSDWMEIAYNASDARRIVNEDKLAIILGIEAEYAFGAENQTFDPVERLNTYYDEGVRTFYLAHKINSRLAGADVYFPPDSDPGKAIRVTQAISGCFYYDDNVAHFPLQESVGAFRFNVCDNNCDANAFKGGKPLDRCAYKHSDISEANMADYILFRGGTEFNGFKLYPWTPGFEGVNGEGGTRVVNDIERNNLGLSHDGERVVRAAMLKGMIVNIDHVSSLARDRMHELATEAFDNYPLNALHNKPNERLSNKKKFWRHEYDLFHNELGYIKETGGFFGFRMGPTDALDDQSFGVAADCPRTSTESAKMLAWLIKEGLNVGYSLDYGTVTQGVYSRTMERCGLDLGNDRIDTYKMSNGTTFVTDGISHVGMMKQWHKELESIHLDQKYVDALRDDGVEAFLEMWEKSEAAAGTGEQITRIVFGGANPHVH